MGSTFPIPAAGPGTHLRVHAISVYVRDQELSLRFYLHRLGFRLISDALVESGERWISVAPADGGALLTLIAPKPDSALHALIGRPTGVVFVTEDLPNKYAEWRRRGVRFQYAPRLRRIKPAQPANPDCEDQLQAWGGVFTHFKDPDGNQFALVDFDEVTRELEAQRRTLALKLEAERRAAHELDIAKQVQARLFPQTPPPIRTLEYAGACIQARQVGGDYFDFLELGAERFALIVGDIAGKGMAAALLMANLQASLRIHCATAQGDTQSLLRSVNQVFYKNTHDSAYATLFYAEYDDAARSLRYANCGHLPALLLRSGNKVERLGATGTVVGAFGEWDCIIEERKLYPGDILAVYTDGVTESFNNAEEEFGEERLTDVLRQNRGLKPPEMIAAVVREIQRFSTHEQYDDITLTIAKCR